MKTLILSFLLLLNCVVLNAQILEMTPIERATSYYHQHKYNKALGLAQKIVSRNPTHYEAYLLMAKVYLELKKPELRENAYQKALVAAPKVPEVYERYGSFLRGNKRLEEAQQLYKKGTEQLPNNARIHYLLGSTFYDQEDFKSTQACLNQAIALDDDESLYYFLRARVYEELKDFDKSLKDFDQAIELEPQNAIGYGARSRLKLMLKDYPGALADAQKAQASGDESYKNAVQECKSNIAREYSRLYSEWEKKDIQKALEYLKKAVEWTPIAKSRQTYLNIIEIKETALKEAETKQRLEAEINTAHQQSVALIKAKKYKEAYALLDAILRKMTGTEQVLLPAYEKMMMLRMEVKWALEDLEKKKD